MTSFMMTMLGIIAGTVAMANASLPVDTPVYLKVVIGALNAAMSIYLGKTHTGTK